jgi:hypothetical protein
MVLSHPTPGAVGPLIRILDVDRSKGVNGQPIVFLFVRWGVEEGRLQWFAGDQTPSVRRVGMDIADSVDIKQPKASTLTE